MTDKEDIETALADIKEKHSKVVLWSVARSLLALTFTLGAYFYATVGIAHRAPDIRVIVVIGVASQLVMALDGIANNLSLANAYRALKLRRAADPRDDTAP